jgi:hypothetical protein
MRVSKNGPLDQIDISVTRRRQLSSRDVRCVGHLGLCPDAMTRIWEMVILDRALTHL